MSTWAQARSARASVQKRDLARPAVARAAADATGRHPATRGHTIPLPDPPAFSARQPAAAC